MRKLSTNILKNDLSPIRSEEKQNSSPSMIYVPSSKVIMYLGAKLDLQHCPKKTKLSQLSCNKIFNLSFSKSVNLIATSSFISFTNIYSSSIRKKLNNLRIVIYFIYNIKSRWSLINFFVFNINCNFYFFTFI